MTDNIYYEYTPPDYATQQRWELESRVDQLERRTEALESLVLRLSILYLTFSVALVLVNLFL
jgi:hypothetical protein